MEETETVKQGILNAAEMNAEEIPSSSQNLTPQTVTVKQGIAQTLPRRGRSKKQIEWSRELGRRSMEFKKAKQNRMQPEPKSQWNGQGNGQGNDHELTHYSQEPDSKGQDETNGPADHQGNDPLDRNSSYVWLIIPGIIICALAYRFWNSKMNSKKQTELKQPELKQVELKQRNLNLTQSKHSEPNSKSESHHTFMILEME